jgi:hypothetical protein
MAKHELNYGVIVDSLNEAIKHSPDWTKNINEEIYKLQDLQESRASIVINNKLDSLRVEYDFSTDTVYSVLMHMIQRDDESFYLGTKKALASNVKCVAYFKPYKTKDEYIDGVLSLMVRLFENATVRKALRNSDNYETKELLLKYIQEINIESDE